MGGSSGDEKAADGLRGALDLIEADHRRVRDLFLQIARAAPVKRPGLIETAAAMICRHFDFEEMLMRREGYPLAAPHREAHSALLDQLNRFLSLAEAHPEEVSAADLPAFFESRLSDHMEGEDEKFIAFCEKKRLSEI